MWAGRTSTLGQQIGHGVAIRLDKPGRPRSFRSGIRHHSLVAWQRADDLFIRVHKIAIHSFPAFERFALSAQLRRAAYSVPDRLHFLNIAEASLAEAAYCVHAAWRLAYINDSLLAELEKDLNGVGAPLSGLSRSLKSSDDAEE